MSLQKLLVRRGLGPGVLGRGKEFLWRHQVLVPLHAIKKTNIRKIKSNALEPLAPPRTHSMCRQARCGYIYICICIYWAQGSAGFEGKTPPPIRLVRTFDFPLIPGTVSLISIASFGLVRVFLLILYWSPSLGGGGHATEDCANQQSLFWAGGAAARTVEIHSPSRVVVVVVYKSEDGAQNKINKKTRTYLSDPVCGPFWLVVPWLLHLIFQHAFCFVCVCVVSWFWDPKSSK